MNRFVLLSVLVVACGGKSPPAPVVDPASVAVPEPPSEGILIAELRDGVPVLREGLLLRDSFYDSTRIGSTEVVKVGAGFHLVQRAEKSNSSCRISAVALVETPAGLRLAAPGGAPIYQMCNGVNCTECAFTTDESGAIAGCGDCLAAGPEPVPAHCDHMISTALPDVVVHEP